MAIVYVGLGSNIGDRESHLMDACRLLHLHPAIAVEAVSSLYRSAPVGVTDQASFVNAVARLQTTLSPPSLLTVTQATERRVGRTPTYHWGPRVVDIDLLLYDALQLRLPYLTIPHAALPERAFVLVPLQELAPDLGLPSGHHIKNLLDALPTHEDVQPIGPFPPFIYPRRLNVSHQEHRQQAPEQVRCAVVTVSDTRTPETDSSGKYMQEALTGTGHAVSAYMIVKDEPEDIRRLIQHHIQSPETDAVLLSGGTGLSSRDGTYEVVQDYLDKELTGFGELFRMLSYEEIGAAAMMSRATAGVAGQTVIVSMPGSSAAVRLALDKLILPELAHMTHIAQG